MKRWDVYGWLWSCLGRLMVLLHPWNVAWSINFPSSWRGKNIYWLPPPACERWGEDDIDRMTVLLGYNCKILIQTDKVLQTTFSWSGEGKICVDSQVPSPRSLLMKSFIPPSPLGFLPENSGVGLTLIERPLLSTSFSIKNLAWNPAFGLKNF